DRPVELENRRSVRGDGGRKALDLRIQANAHQRIAARPAGLQLLDEGAHATRGCRVAPRFFRCTSRIEIAAGVTPGMRPACPIVAGRDCCSFWRTSCDRPVSCK